MFWIPEAEELNLLDAKDRIDFNSIINTRKYTVKDSTMTYRQANSMASDNMLPEDKDRNNGWRKFSLKELIYIELVLSLKKLGLKHSQLRNVWDSFFNPYKNARKEKRLWRELSDDVIALVMGHIDIVLTITESGEVSYIHPAFFTIVYPTKEPFVFVSMSDIVNKVATRIGKEGFTPKVTLNTVEYSLTAKEEKVLTLLRDHNFKTIKLTKKDGEIELIRAEKVNEIDVGSVTAIMEAISKGRYQNISITQRDGKVVNFTQEVTMKA